MGTVHGSIGYAPTLEQATEDAELIVDVTIIEWLGENDEWHRSFFSARVNQTFKGEEYDEIEIVQSGSSHFTLSYHPLFKVGDRMLLFLVERKWTGVYTDITINEWNELYLDKYNVLSYIDVMDIWEYEGETYLLNRIDFSPFFQSVILSEEVIAVSKGVKDEIAAQYLEYDPIFEYAVHYNVHQNIFTFDSVTDKIIRIVNQNNDCQGEDEDNDDGDDDQGEDVNI